MGKYDPSKTMRSARGNLSDNNSNGEGSNAGRGSPGSRFGSSYYPGSHRYVYYSGGKAMYYFSDRPYTREDAVSKKTSGILTGAIFTILVIAFMYMLFPQVVHIFNKVDTHYDTRIVIKDEARTLSKQDRDILNSSLVSFRDVTGVTPAYISVKAEEWEKENEDLKTYAQQTYNTLFKDERHWLIVYSDGGSRDLWAWEGVLGEECSKAIYPETEDALTRAMQQNLQDESAYTIGKAVAAAFADIIPDIAKTTINKKLLPATVLAFVFLAVGLTALISGIRINPDNDPKLKAKQCKNDKSRPTEDVCACCGGIYVHGMHLKCPHCDVMLSTSKTKKTKDNIHNGEGEGLCITLYVCQLCGFLFILLHLLRL